jgi:hypothetical protein
MIGNSTDAGDLLQEKTNVKRWNPLDKTNVPLIL